MLPPPKPDLGDSGRVTPFSFVHTFRAPSPAVVFAAYFDAVHQREQDAVLDIAEREVLELTDDGSRVRRVCRVVPQRQIPAIARAVLGGPLEYLDTAVWDRHTNEIAVDVRVGSRIHIAATYALAAIGDFAIRRTYAGSVTVDVALVGGRVERGIVAEFQRSLPAAAACTQGYLDRTLGTVPSTASLERTIVA